MLSIGFTDDEINRPSTLPPLQENIVHEVNVYRLLTKYTDIPVPDPKSISSDFDAAGRIYIRIERIEKTVRASAALKRCWMPLEHRSSSTDADGPYDRYARIIRRNADYFVHYTVLPELRRLRSRTTGLDGFVVPLRQTLQIAVLINIEEARYFPEEIQQRTFNTAALEALCGDEDLARRHIGLLSPLPTLSGSKDGVQER
ncbi:hypothetical protein QBC40DRAFT_313758 [Triangularia verruculosa]|uniref:Uncharacterized protein n=1 Tax=Triangularia verruculosa TaxID=2587418 RepID=A0AAN6XBN0_9PEZI|nr:hypothetical protein QBC40DRAFT_313758 [Triangularia verruculosa]